MNKMQIRIEMIKDFCVKNKVRIGIIYCIIFALTLIAQICFICFPWISIIREVASFFMLLIALIPNNKNFHQEKQFGGIFNVGYEYGRFLFDFIKNISNITNDDLQNTSIFTKNKICKFYNIDNKLYFNPSSDNYIEKERSTELQIKLDDFQKYKSLLIEDKIIEEKNNKPNTVEFVYELNATEIYELVKKIAMFEHSIEDRLK